MKMVMIKYQYNWLETITFESPYSVKSGTIEVTKQVSKWVRVSSAI